MIEATARVLPATCYIAPRKVVSFMRETGFCIARVSERIESNPCLRREFLGAAVHIEEHELVINGVGFRARSG